MEPFTPEEAEFLAEFTTVEIMPAAHLDELELIMVPGTAHGLCMSRCQETVPAMTPPLPLRVPLWLAISLRKSTGCQIIPPSWLSACIPEGAAPRV